MEFEALTGYSVSFLPNGSKPYQQHVTKPMFSLPNYLKLTPVSYTHLDVYKRQVLVPLLTGLSVSTTLLCAGLGTLLFHLVTKGKVPAFLGSCLLYTSRCV